jgi:sugar phosphate isomerase/epimerase
MKFGVACPVVHAETVLSVGFDYVELPAASTFGDPSFDLAQIRDLPTPVTNMFFPGEIRIPKPIRNDYLSYVERMFARAESCGVEIMVVGSGGSRRAPDGYDVSRAEQDFVDVVADCQSVAERHGIRLAPESLNHLETNVWNDLGRLARALDEVQVAYTADTYHVLIEGQETDLIGQIPFRPAHIHLGNFARTPPTEDDIAVRDMVQHAIALGYDARLTLEARHDWDPDSLLRALKGIRALL